MRVLLAIPVYNEAQHVRAVLDEARRYIQDILVLDDGSTDDTPVQLAQIPGISIVRHPQNQGYGQSLIDAFNFAICHRYDWIITMDCDGQHEPSFLPEFLLAARRGDGDIISGSRYMMVDQQDGSPPPDRRAINAEITALLNSQLSLNLTDAFCGFKAYRVGALVALRLTEPGYAMPLQLWVHAVRRGLRIREIPVRLIYNDPNRSFGGPLDDAQFRRRHYLEVLDRAMTEEVGAMTGCYCMNVGECVCRC